MHSWDVNPVKQMLSVPVMYNGVGVTVVTRPESDYKEKDRLSVREVAGSLGKKQILLRTVLILPIE